MAKTKELTLTYPGGFPALPKQKQLHLLTDGGKYKVKGIKGGYACLPEWTPVRMGDGTFRPISEVGEGDFVMGFNNKSGYPTKVVAKINSGLKEVYRIYTRDGFFVDASKEHVFVINRQYYCHGKYRKENEEWSVEKIINYLDSNKLNSKNIGFLRPDYLDYDNHPDLMIDPYLLGILLGDGYINRTAIRLSSHKDDNEVRNSVSKILKQYNCHLKYIKDCDYSIVSDNFYNELNEICRDIDLHSKNKYIPNEYFVSSLEDRLELLAGLIDSDGHLMDGGKHGRVSKYEFVNKNKNIADGVAKLINEMGGKVTISEMRVSGYDSIYYRLYIALPHEIPCRLPRKQADGKHQRNYAKSGITHYESLGFFQCYDLSVDNKTKLFLTYNDYITHNSGKTYWLMAESLMQLVESPNNIGLFGRLTLDEIRRTLLPVFYEMCPPELILGQNKNEQYIEILNVSGRRDQASKLFYIALDDTKGAINKIKSMNLGFAALDQLEELSEEVFHAIEGRLRNPNGRRQFLFTANPEGHNWIWKKWVKNKGKNKHAVVLEANAWTKDAPEPTMEMVEKKAEELGINAGQVMIKHFPDMVQHTDNPYLPMDYLISLLAYPEKLKNRYVFGKDDEFTGLIYPDFEEDIHCALEEPPLSDKNLVRVIAMDWGKRNPCAVLFMDVDADGNVYVVDELYFPEMTPAQIKTLIFAKNKGKKVRAWVADPSIWRTMEKGMNSVGDSFASRDDASGQRIVWQRANNSVDYGIGVVEKYLRRDNMADTPDIYFIKGKTPNTIDEIYDYRYKELAESLTTSKMKNKPEEPRKYKDHLMDALRYGLVTIQDQRIKAERRMDKKLLKALRNINMYGTPRGDIRPGMVA